MLESEAKFAEAALVRSAHREGRVSSIHHRRIGPVLVFGRLWDGLQLPQVLERLPANRRLDLPLERILFLTMKTLRETRPIFHKRDETIRGHVFCSFLALLLRKELKDRLEAQGDKLEWTALLHDVAALQYTEVNSQGKRFVLRSDLEETCATVFRAVGVAIPPSAQRVGGT